MSRNSIVMCDNSLCQHQEHGRCTAWKIQLGHWEGDFDSVLSCETYSDRKVALPPVPYPAGDDHEW